VENDQNEAVNKE